MATETKKKFRLGLSGSILLGFVLGIAVTGCIPSHRIEGEHGVAES
jgi:hypothetical protein